MATVGQSVRIRIGDKGRVVIPVEIRKELGIKDGDVLDWRVENGEIRVSTLQNRLRRAQERVRHLIPAGTLISEELIAERREAALHE